MNKHITTVCPVCKSTDNTFYIATNALMHKKNDECYLFNKCQVCQAVFLTNPVRESDLHQYYTDIYLPYRGAFAWGKYKSFVTASQSNLDLKRTQIVANEIRNTKSVSILDVGCGNPSFLATVIQKLGVHGTGIDFSNSGWKDGSFDNLELYQTSIVSFKPQKTYDIITLWHYLEHDYNVTETIQKLYDCLNKNGKLIIEVPDYDSLTAKRQQEFWQGWHSPRHLTLFSKKSFQVLFPEQQWTIKKHKRYGTLDAFTLWWLGKMEAQKINWSANMERRFWNLVFLKIITFPIFIFEKLVPMGIQLIIIEKK